MDENKLTMTEKIKISEAKEMEKSGKLDYISAKFMAKGRKTQEYYETVDDALEYKDDDDLYGSFWVYGTDIDYPLELTDEEGNIL